MERLRLEELRRQLNPPQWEAVSQETGPLLVLAGAGSGKTRVLTYRIAYLVAQAGIAPHEILAVTFTNKAAREMRRRVQELLGPLAEGLWVGTFHGICLRILRSHGDLLPVGPGFSVYDADDQKRLAKSVVEELDLDPKRFKPTALLHHAQRAKDEGQGPDELDAGGGPYGNALSAFYRRYQQRLRAANALDFGDLLLEGLRLLRTQPAVGDRYRARFRHLLVDEYQDTNRVQYGLAREIARGHGNLCVVGDDDQSIYSWRGADLRNILAFEGDFPGARVIKLEQNYRSTEAILAAASSVVARNESRHPKTLWTERSGGAPVEVHEAPTEEEEAAWVAERIQVLCAAGRSLSQVAVLYRMHALSRAFEEAFLSRRIPYVVYGGLRFYDRKEVKDALAYLRLTVNANDPVTFLRVVNTPARGIGKTTLDALRDLADARGLGIWDAAEAALAEGLLATRAARALAGFLHLANGWREGLGTLPLRDLLVRILEESGYLAAVRADGTDQAEDRLENLEELLNAAEAFEAEADGGVQEFLDRAALVSDQDVAAEGSQAVTLMTLHSAKGLEYPAVFVAGLEEGVFPHHMSSDDPAQLEEERRLCYVGMTRAMEHLYLTRAMIRRVYGAEGFFRPRSRFLEELPPGVYRPAGQGPAPGRPGAAPAAEAQEATGRFYAPDPEEAEYRPGLRVRHPRYGLGTVQRVEGRGPRARVAVQFAGGDLRRFLAGLAGLEIALDD